MTQDSTVSIVVVSCNRCLSKIYLAMRPEYAENAPEFKEILQESLIAILCSSCVVENVNEEEANGRLLVWEPPQADA